MSPRKKATKKKAARRIRRSARSGEFVTPAADAKKHPATTVTETTQ